MSKSNPKSSTGPALAIALSLALLFGTLTLLGSVTPTTIVPPEPQFEESARQTRTLRFGRIPNVSPREAYRVYSGLVTLLDEQLSCCDVELVLAPDYASCVKMLADKKIDLAWLGTATYVVEREQTPMVPLVRPIWSGRAGYAGVLFTLEGSGIKALEDLRGKRLAFVDEQSASGYVYPANLLIAKGFDLEKDFSATDFLGSHDAVLMAVLLGEYDAGAVFERAYFTVADRARRMQLRVLAQTEVIPGEPIVAGAHLDEALVEEVRAAFMRIQTERLQETALRDLFGFEPATDEQYTGVRLLGK
jgi:phosphate/phosphite/phosphonate ABC transporter binding protein